MSEDIPTWEQLAKAKRYAASQIRREASEAARAQIAKQNLPPRDEEPECAREVRDDDEGIPEGEFAHFRYPGRSGR